MRYSLVWFTKPKKFISKKIQFIIIGKELTKKCKVHYQAYAEMKKKTSFKQLKRLFGRTVHIEKAKKSAIHNIAYCCKDGSIYHCFGSPCEQRAAHLLAHFSNSQKVKAKDAVPKQEEEALSVKEEKISKTIIQKQGCEVFQSRNEGEGNSLLKAVQCTSAVQSDHHEGCD